ncbi:2-(1,2-epoxy-1,2-dihydrophenyl)acetyl-CoA isomerase [Variovorax boronicumulans]|uniref:enoyl-CoA hydratase-related protein n=1 Tax=Variovorax boronicumulans TaxID=436515 RepID=UPI00278A1487|nr:enoyl-CoA hydratase-related protein [Variovorax boronicumulans]MDP9917418.1 2-(1,2-epoxy-1,2-dihydrophenyl)acetyl-CoA isomerase [Variovorax boronicumulans]
MSNPSVLYTREGSVAIVTLNNPQRLNPMNEPLCHELLDVLADVNRDKTVRALLLTAVGRLFSAGGDLNAGAFAGQRGTRGENTLQALRTRVAPLIAGLRELPVPIVVGINGGVSGGGVGLALTGDVILAARSAYFYLPFIKKLGIVPDYGATWFLERRLGYARALALTLTGERLCAEKAEQWGLIQACVDDEALPDAAMKMAQQLAQLPAHGVLEARAAFDSAHRNDLREQLDYEARRQGELLELPTLEEGVKAFFEKRTPNFPSRS